VTREPAAIRVVGATDGDPWAQSTWSGSSARLWSALERRGALAGVVSVKPRWLDLAERAASVSRDRTAWRQRYRGAASPLSPLVRRAMTALGSRRALRAGRGADAVLQISGWYDARRAMPPGTLLCTYQDANVALWRGRPDLELDPGDPGLRRTFEHERRAYASMDLVMTMSEWARRSFVEDFGLPPAKVVAVGAGANLDSLPEPTVRGPSPPRLLFVGLKFDRKGGPDLLAAFARLRAEQPEAELWIVGPPPGPAAPGVRWHGPVYRSTPEGARELDRLFREATVFALPSIYEGFGMPFLEAMAYGLPCVGSDVCAIPEIVRDGETGVIVPARDPRALHAALAALAADPARAAALGARGREAVDARWTWDAVAGRIVGAVAERLPSRPSG
jgi:glycosyltransferase involved in cell wall biosynthesis